MKTDTADEHWNSQWANIEEDSKWLTAEPDVLRWAKTLAPGASILDLGAGVGRHALALAEVGFSVSALDAAPEGLAAIDGADTNVTTRLGRMDDLPFEDQSFDHVLSWNVIYHGDEDVLLRSIHEIRRVLKPGGSFLGTMLSKRRLPSELEAASGREISRNAWVFDVTTGDKMHPHYFCSAAELLALFQGFECRWLEDREHESPARTIGTWKWNVLDDHI